jgi:hypothetical protein
VGYLLSKYGLRYDADSRSDYITSNVKLIANNELEVVWNEAVVDKFEVLFQNLPGERKGNLEDRQSTLRIGT